VSRERVHGEPVTDRLQAERARSGTGLLSGRCPADSVARGVCGFCIRSSIGTLGDVPVL
jgi:hypothetical protein